LALFGTILLILPGWWFWRAAVADPEVPRASLHTTLTNALDEVRSRVTGGIGVLVSVGGSNGTPILRVVASGSPAEQSGLRSGDCILAVNGVATTNRAIADVASQIRGFSGGSLTLLVGRPGITNREYVVERASWNSLRAGGMRGP
jgi:C-terminal processing protease CtpA/Prc